MKAFALTAAMLMAAGSASAVVPAAIDADPLMKQILAKQIALPNGGVTAAAPLAPAEGLVERREEPAKKRKARPARRAVEQAENLESSGPAASFERAAK
jgi:hypothetical protein